MWYFLLLSGVTAFLVEPQYKHLYDIVNGELQSFSIALARCPNTTVAKELRNIHIVPYGNLSKIIQQKWSASVYPNRLIPWNAHWREITRELNPSRYDHLVDIMSSENPNYQQYTDYNIFINSQSSHEFTQDSQSPHEEELQRLVRIERFPDGELIIFQRLVIGTMFFTAINGTYEQQCQKWSQNSFTGALVLFLTYVDSILHMSSVCYVYLKDQDQWMIDLYDRGDINIVKALLTLF